MRRFSSLASVLLAAVFAFQPAPASANHPTPPPNLPAGTDWVLLTVPITRDSNSLYMRFETSGVLDGTGPAVLGFGSTGSFFGPFVDTFNMGGGPVDITTSEGAMSQRVQIQPGGPGGTFGGSFSSSCSGRCLTAGTVLRALVFVTNGTLTYSSSLVVDDIGVVPSTVTSGSGSGVITAGQVTNGGTGAAVAGLAVGSTTDTATTTDAIVGAFAYGNCLVGVCNSTWTAPDGTSGDVASIRGGVIGFRSGEATFGGVAGSWSWSWTGTVGTSAIGAFAPIGNAWRDFVAAS